MCANSCRYYYGTSSPSFPDLSPPRDMPQPHKTISRKIQQFTEDPDSIEFCLDDEPTVSARYFKNGHCRHKTYDPQVRWSRNNIAVTMERFQPITSPSSTSESSSYTSHPDQEHAYIHQKAGRSKKNDFENKVPITSPLSQSESSYADYAYAYYEPGAIMCHSNIPTPEEVAGPSVLPPPNSMRALLIKTKEKPNKSQTTSRSYATHENIYEDVSDDKHRRLASSAQSLNERGCSKKEFQHILNNHYRVLEELNLSVEELLMSSSPPKDPAVPSIVNRSSQPCVTTLSTEMLSLDLKDDMRSPVSELVVGEDSGFSGSSSGASYIGSLRNYKTAITRSLRRSSAPNCSSGSSGTIYGSCRTAKFPNESRIGSFYGTSQMKDNKSIDSSQKSLKFSIWNKRI